MGKPKTGKIAGIVLCEVINMTATSALMPTSLYGRLNAKSVALQCEDFEQCQIGFIDVDLRPANSTASSSFVTITSYSRSNLQTDNTTKEIRVCVSWSSQRMN
jgi:hypothetical protein